jgi:hypothetical protein
MTVYLHADVEVVSKSFGTDLSKRLWKKEFLGRWEDDDADSEALGRT